MQKRPQVAEQIFSPRKGNAERAESSEVVIRHFVSDACGSDYFGTGIATFGESAVLPYHAHGYGEAVTVLQGRARMSVEGRSYSLGQGDCIFIPAGVAHAAQNEVPQCRLTMHWAASAARTSREITDQGFPADPRGQGDARPHDPEKIMRFQHGHAYELSPGAFFRDLFAKRLGAAGICGGHARFAPGASLPCHIHDFDESITIVEGCATCWVEGRAYELSNCDTAYIPRNTPHRFLNRSSGEMAMIWVYAGDEPDRQIVQAALCNPAGMDLPV